MQLILGQDSLLNTLDSFTIQTLPKTIMFIGEAGAGKHLLASYLADKFNFEKVFVSKDVTPEDLIEYSQSPIEKFYIIDLAEFTEKQQNKILKFIEEPSSTVFVILLTATTVGVLPTILNRCIKYTLAPYAKQFLIDHFSWTVADVNPLVFDICTTPGQLANADGKAVIALHDLCSLIVTKFKAAPYPNALTIINTVNYKDEYSKFDFDQFFRMLELVAFEDFKKTNSETSFKIYTLTNKAKQATLISKTLNKETYMLNFIDSLWRAVQ